MHRKDISLDIRSNISFCGATKAKISDFSQPIEARSHTEANDRDPDQIESRPPKTTVKAGSAKTLTRTKTVVKPEELQYVVKGKGEVVNLKMQPRKSKIM